MLQSFSCRTVVLVTTLVLGGGGWAGTASAQAPSIEGTYKLVSRELPNGTVLRPPDAMGLWTFTKTHRSFTIVRKNAEGKVTLRSIMSTYKLSATEYTETFLFSAFSDQIGGKDIVHDFAGKTQSVAVKHEGGRIEFKLPFEPPFVVFEGNKIVARGPGGVDIWEKVE